MTPLKIFKIKPEERIQSAIALIVIIALNALFIYRMHELFMQPGFGPYFKTFERELHLSGYDPLTYMGVTDWDAVYQVYRHPLLSFMIWPLWLINQALTWMLGVNCVQYLVAAVLIRVAAMGCHTTYCIFLLVCIYTDVSHSARSLYYINVPVARNALYLRRMYQET